MAESADGMGGAMCEGFYTDVVYKEVRLKIKQRNSFLNRYAEGRIEIIVSGWYAIR